ncbi:MAG: ThuA domain-containing protein [candidate division Zixibacteria bacterium]|nr:ThuA domain-containing protein [candidate division Zixibacteria bacterium]
MIFFLVSCSGGQKPDLNFNATVANPTYTAGGPKVLFDEAHNNVHKSNDRYKPLAKLLASDGFQVTAGKEKFSDGMLKGYSVLIIVGALSEDEHTDRPAFSSEECDAVENWVREGGSLLLIVDHYPFGSTAEGLALRFGVQTSKGYTEDSALYDKESGDVSQIVFSRTDGSLAEHSITLGRDSTERTNHVTTFTGTSLLAADSAAAFLKLSDRALDFAPSAKIEKSGGDTKTIVTYGNPTSAAGRAQGVALRFGKGRVVILGEIAILSAQITRNGKPVGMNHPGNDNKQLALNIMHWLSGVVE